MVQWWFAEAAAQEAVIIDRVVAVVQGEPLLASDVRLSERLATSDPSPVPLWRVGLPSEELAIDALILRITAADISLYQPTQEAIVERTAALRQTLGAEWEPFLFEHGLDEVRAQSVLRRRMVVERFLLRNLRASPEDDVAWLAEYGLLLEQLRERVRIRTISPRALPTEDLP